MALSYGFHSIGSFVIPDAREASDRESRAAERSLGFLDSRSAFGPPGMTGPGPNCSSGNGIIADFACRERKVVVELDGETRSTDEELAADARRTALLNAQGYAAMRFTDQQLYENADAVAEAILAVLVENSG